MFLRSAVRTFCSLSTFSPFPTIRSDSLLPNRSKEKNLQLYEQLISNRQSVLSVSEEKRGGAKLTVRERLSLLADEGSQSLEIGLLAGFGFDYGDVPCAGVIVSLIQVCGETCMVSANDWTVKGGCSYPITLKKQLRGQEIALQNRLPCIYLVDSGGAFLPLQVGA